MFSVIKKAYEGITTRDNDKEAVDERKRCKNASSKGGSKTRKGGRKGRRVQEGFTNDVGSNPVPSAKSLENGLDDDADGARKNERDNIESINLESRGSQKQLTKTTKKKKNRTDDENRSGEPVENFQNGYTDGDDEHRGHVDEEMHLYDGSVGINDVSIVIEEQESGWSIPLNPSSNATPIHDRSMNSDWRCVDDDTYGTPISTPMTAGGGGASTRRNHQAHGERGAVPTSGRGSSYINNAAGVSGHSSNIFDSPLSHAANGGNGAATSGVNHVSPNRLPFMKAYNNGRWTKNFNANTSWLNSAVRAGTAKQRSLSENALSNVSNVRFNIDTGSKQMMATTAADSNTTCAGTDSGASVNTESDGIHQALSASFAEHAEDNIYHQKQTRDKLSDEEMPRDKLTDEELMISSNNVLVGSNINPAVAPPSGVGMNAIPYGATTQTAESWIPAQVYPGNYHHDIYAATAAGYGMQMHLPPPPPPNLAGHCDPTASVWAPPPNDLLRHPQVEKEASHSGNAQSAGGNFQQQCYDGYYDMNVAVTAAVMGYHHAQHEVNNSSGAVSRGDVYTYDAGTATYVEQVPKPPPAVKVGTGNNQKGWKNSNGKKKRPLSATSRKLLRNSNIGVMDSDGNLNLIQRSPPYIHGGHQQLKRSGKNARNQQQSVHQLGGTQLQFSRGQSFPNAVNSAYNITEYSTQDAALQPYDMTNADHFGSSAVSEAQHFEVGGHHGKNTNSHAFSPESMHMNDRYSLFQGTVSAYAKEESIPSLRTLPPGSISHHHTEGIGLSARVSRAERADLGDGYQGDSTCSDSSTRSNCARYDRIKDMIQQRTSCTKMQYRREVSSMQSPICDKNAAIPEQRESATLSLRKFPDSASAVRKKCASESAGPGSKSPKPNGAFSSSGEALIAPVALVLDGNLQREDINHARQNPETHELFTPENKKKSETSEDSALVASDVLIWRSHTVCLTPEGRADSTCVGQDSNNFEKSKSSLGIVENGGTNSTRASYLISPVENSGHPCAENVGKSSSEGPTFAEKLSCGNQETVFGPQFDSRFAAGEGLHNTELIPGINFESSPDKVTEQKPDSVVCVEEVTSENDCASSGIEAEAQRFDSASTNYEYAYAWTPTVARKTSCSNHAMSQNGSGNIGRSNVCAGEIIRNKSVCGSQATTGTSAARTANYMDVRGWVAKPFAAFPEFPESPEGHAAYNQRRQVGHADIGTPPAVVHSPNENREINNATGTNTANDMGKSAGNDCRSSTRVFAGKAAVASCARDDTYVDAFKFAEPELRQLDNAGLLRVLVQYIRTDVEHERICKAFDLYIAKLYASEDSLETKPGSISPNHRSKTFDFLLQVCGESRQLKLAEYFYQQIIRRENPSPQFVHAMMQLYANSEMYGKACDVFFSSNAAEKHSAKTLDEKKLASYAGTAIEAQQCFASSIPSTMNLNTNLNKQQSCQSYVQSRDYPRNINVARSMNSSPNDRANGSLGYLLKCCVETGSFEAVEAFFASSKPEFHDYMFLIRGFAKQGKLEEARKVVRLVRNREHRNLNIIRPVYNALLDSVVSTGTAKDEVHSHGSYYARDGAGGGSSGGSATVEEMRLLAKQILLEMEQLDLCDSVTYNTYLKGFCQTLEDAFNCLEELRSKRLFTPDRVSYNSILNLAVSVGDTRCAWQIVNEGLHGQKYAIDHYTVTIMLKTVKHQVTNHTNPTIAKNNRSAFELLDKIWIGQDEFLLKTAIDSCIRGKEYKYILKVKFSNFDSYE